MKYPQKLLCLSLLGVSASSWSASLLDLYNESTASDPRLQRAESEAAIYQAREKQSRGALLPQAQIGAQGTRTVRDAEDNLGDNTRDYYNGERYYFSVSQSLYDKSGWEAWRSSGREADQYIAMLEETRSLIAVDLADRYTKVLAAEDNFAFVVAEREAAEEQLKLVKARYERQLARVTDLLAIEARRDMLLSSELEARNQVLLAREAMSEVLGREVGEPFDSLRQNIGTPLELGLLDDWMRQGMTANAGLKASRLAVQAAVSRVREAQGQRHPMLALNLNAQRSDIGFENALQPVRDTYVAALNLTIPIYSGGQVSAQVAEAQARLRMAENEYDQVERTLRKDIRQAWLNARSANDRVKATRRALESAEKSYQAQQKGLEYGTVTVVDVLDALEAQYEARRDHRQAYYDLMVQGLTLHQVAGQFGPETLVQFNAWLESGEQSGS